MLFIQINLENVCVCVSSIDGKRRCSKEMRFERKYDKDHLCSEHLKRIQDVI